MPPKKRIHDSRVEGTRHLVNALSAQSHRPRVLVCASAVGYYGSRGDQILTEASSPGTDFLARVVVEWEEAAQLAESLDMRVVRLRFGMVLGHGGALAKLLPPFRFGVGGKLGSGHQWMAWIHLEDAVNLILFAIRLHRCARRCECHCPASGDERRIHGPIGVRRCIARRSFQFRRFALKLAFGEMSDMVLASQRVLPTVGQIRRFSVPISGFACSAGQSPG